MVSGRSIIRCQRETTLKVLYSRTASTPFFPCYLVLHVCVYNTLKSSLHKKKIRHGRRRPERNPRVVARKTNSLTPDGSTITSANASPRTHRIRATCSRSTRRTPKTRASRTRTWRRSQKRRVVFLRGVPVFLGRVRRKTRAAHSVLHERRPRPHVVGHDGADVRFKRAVVAGVALLRGERNGRRTFALL